MTPEGIVMDVNLEQLEKQESHKFVIPDGNNISVKATHEEKQLYPRLVIPDGNVTRIISNIRSSKGAVAPLLSCNCGTCCNG